MSDESQRLHHLTITTCNMTTPLLSKIMPDALGITETWLREAAAAPVKVPVPGHGDSGYSAQTWRQATTILQTVYAPDGAPLVSFGVAVEDDGDALQMWLSLQHSDAAMPLLPWCAVLLYQGLESHQDALDWLGDYERCVAIAWTRIQRGMPA